MTNFVNRCAQAIGQAVGSLRAKRYQRRGKPKRYLIIPPASIGSLGDSAMIYVAAQQLRGSGAELVEIYGEPPVGKDEKIDRFIAADRFFYRGSPLQQLRAVARIAKYTGVFFIGADVLDGRYRPKSVIARLSLLAEAARLDIPATVLGSSFNKNPKQETVEALRNLPKAVVVCARDPQSQSRLEAVLERPVQLVADLAFLLAPLPEHPAAKAAINWVVEQKQQGKTVLGLNANYLQARDLPEYTDAISQLMVSLLAKDISLVLVPHDIRGSRSDITFLQEARESLSESEQQRVFLLAPKSPGAVKAVLAQVDFLVTGRMHAAILALSSSTPVFTFVYQDKFEGLMQHFELSSWDLTCEPKDFVANPDVVAKRILLLLTEHKAIRQHIEQHLPAVLALASKNIQ